MAAPAPRANTTVESETEFRPLVPDDSKMPEFTFQAVATGTLLGLVFGASSLYLVMKVGMTVSASIPVAVLSITLFRALSKLIGTRTPTILENNITQTAGSAGESIAFGVGVTMPGLMLLGFDMSLSRVMIVSVLGGLLGILMMIPLRRAFIVRLHGKAGEPGKLLYPEGTACANVLQTGEQGGTSGATVAIGFGLAFVHKLIVQLFKFLPETISWPLKFFNKAAVLSTDAAGELLGVGYIIGFRTSSIMMAGAVMGYLVLAPTINFFGAEQVAFGKAIGEMSTSDLATHYIKNIGAGCVSAAGIISMFRTMPMILRTIFSGFSSLAGAKAAADDKRRTNRDMPMWIVLLGAAGLLGLLALWLSTELSVGSAVLASGLVLGFGFLFVTVSSRLTGEIGSSSNPISGMTIATLLVTCLIFLAMSMTGPAERVLALSIGAVVCIAASNGGTTSQDLKTGYLVGGTPVYQQYAILIGALVSALVIGGTLLVFNSAGTIVADVSKTVARKDGETTVEKPNSSFLPRLEAEQAKDGEEKTVGGVPLTLATVLESKRTSPEDILGSFWIDKDRLVRGVDLETLKQIPETKQHEGKSYHVWRPARCAGFTPNSGAYYLLDETGMVRYIVDPTVTGSLHERDDGSTVSFKFPAPKTQVMAAIINSVLSGRVQIELLLIGAMIAIALELCGVSSLAFAVGAYIPMQYTTPIFLGGIVRWGVDSWLNARKPKTAQRDEVAEIAETETSPGVLLASGLIAGGSLAGVLIAFLNFLPERVFKALDFERVESVANAFKSGSTNFAPLVSFALFAILMFILLLYGIKRPKPTTPTNPSA
jgi:putative OPT family oligopeptide transporter